MSDSATHGLLPARLLCPWDFPGKNIGMGCHFILQRIFPTQGSNPRLLHSSSVAGYRLLHKVLAIVNNAVNITMNIVIVAAVKLRLTLCDPMVCTSPGSSVHGISQGRILEWVAISFPRGSSQPRDQTRVSSTGRRILYQ